VSHLQPFEWIITWTDSDRPPKSVVADDYEHVNGFYHFIVAYSSALGDFDRVLTVRDSDVAMIERGRRAARSSMPQPMPEPGQI
jgi:hypothetical protein